MSWSRPFNAIARDYDLPRFTYPQQIAHGDYTLFTDFKELVNDKSTDIHDNEFYIGPIFFDELFNDFSNNRNHINKEIFDHISNGNKSILVSLGSSGTKELFERILHVLGKTDFRVVAVYTSILSPENLPEVNKNIMLKQYVPSMREINEKVDLAILHGGQGTVYTAAYSGKPVIGFPMQFEQHMNLELLERKGMAKIASRRRFNDEYFMTLINEIFSKYNYYLKKSKVLAKSLPSPQGDINACNIIIDLIKKHHNNV
jgi:UDP:flavonoid glycosyltransferase YjiC (YdhE family)